MIARLRIPALISVIALLAVACAETEAPPVKYSGDISKGNPTEEVAENTASGEAPEPSEMSDAQSDALDQALESSPEGCVLLDTTSCLLPFPSDALTVEDPTSPTLRRVNIPTGQLANTGGVPLDPTAWNESDGWSPNTPIIVYVPDLDPEFTKLPPMSDIGMSVTEESATVLVDLDTGQLVPHWAELDAQAAEDGERTLIIRPATSLLETHRIAVGLRNLYGSDGVPIPTPVQFQVLRDNLITDAPELTEQRDAYDEVFLRMAEAGVNRGDLYLAWWFTVASAENLAGRVLSMREDAFGSLNGGAPEFEITNVIRTGLRPGIAHVVEGTLDVPLYLEGGGAPGSPMAFDSAGKPQRTGTYTANFTCTVPEEGVATGESAPVVYGHGLLGSADEAKSTHVQETAAYGNFVYCGTDALGLSEGDVGYVAEVLGNLNLFPPVADRLQQAILNYNFLARLMVHMDGLNSTPEFTTADGAGMLNTFSAYYDGNSQGAILGGAVVAVSQDILKATLGVGGMNYSTLLNRSVDFDQYFEILRVAYPDPVEQQILYGLMQMLWDRGETGGYVQHLTNRPYDLTPAHQVVMNVAWGDHQVANVTADNIARVLGIPRYSPTVPEELEIDEDKWFYDIPTIRKFPHTGSALFYWYTGTLTPPEGNRTVVQGEEWIAKCGGDKAETDLACIDPHEDPRRQPELMELKKGFFQPDGVVNDVCREEPCVAKPRRDFDY